MAQPPVIWLLLILLAFIAVPLTMEATRKPMTDKARSDAPGTFADLSQGRTHYQLSGPEEGPVCLCIHGLTTPSFVWEGLVPELNRMGFRTLTYDLYGRGYSDHIVGRQDAEFFLRQINDLLDHLQIEEDITVMGFSMGGAIATALAASQPHGMERLILLAPAGMLHADTPLIRFAARTPLVGAWLMLLVYPHLLRKGLAAEADLHGTVPDITARQDAELDWRGFVPAVRSSLRYMVSRSLKEDHKLLYREGVPVTAIWGEQDNVIPPDAAQLLASWNPEADNRIIADAGHGLPYTHTARIVAELQDALSHEE